MEDKFTNLQFHLVVVLPDTFWEMGLGGIPQRPNGRVTP